MVRNKTPHDQEWNAMWTGMKNPGWSGMKHHKVRNETPRAWSGMKHHMVKNETTHGQEWNTMWSGMKYQDG